MTKVAAKANAIAEQNDKDAQTQLDKTNQAKNERDSQLQKAYDAGLRQITPDSTRINQRGERLTTLETTLSKGTPAADALVAPELLSAMAGGQGGGLRMNEANKPNRGRRYGMGKPASRIE